MAMTPASGPTPTAKTRISAIRISGMPRQISRKRRAAQKIVRVGARLRAAGKLRISAAVAPIEGAIYAYEIVEASNHGVRIEIRDEEFSLPEISAMVLREMKQIAERHAGGAVTKVRTTVVDPDQLARFFGSAEEEILRAYMSWRDPPSPSNASAPATQPQQQT